MAQQGRVEELAGQMANAGAGNDGIDANDLLGRYVAANEAAANQQAPNNVPPPAPVPVEPHGARINDVEDDNVDLNGRSDASRILPLLPDPAGKKSITVAELKAYLEDFRLASVALHTAHQERVNSMERDSGLVAELCKWKEAATRTMAEQDEIIAKLREENAELRQKTDLTLKIQEQSFIAVNRLEKAYSVVPVNVVASDKAPERVLDNYNIDAMMDTVNADISRTLIEVLIDRKDDSEANSFGSLPGMKGPKGDDVLKTIREIPAVKRCSPEGLSHGASKDSKKFEVWMAILKYGYRNGVPFETLRTQANNALSSAFLRLDNKLFTSYKQVVEWLVEYRHFLRLNPKPTDNFESWKAEVKSLFASSDESLQVEVAVRQMWPSALKAYLMANLAECKSFIALDTYEAQWSKWSANDKMGWVKQRFEAYPSIRSRLMLELSRESSEEKSARSAYFAKRENTDSTMKRDGNDDSSSKRRRTRGKKQEESTEGTTPTLPADPSSSGKVTSERNNDKKKPDFPK